MLTWNVYIGDFSKREIVVHNVFDHYGFLEDCKKAAKKYKDDREAFEKAIENNLMFYYWSKCEWEIILQHWPQISGFQDEKVDVYDQVMLNWDKFIEYVWNNAEELRRREKKK